jgi:hypothetical protein
VKSKKLSNGLMQIVFSVCALVILALLASNIIIILMAGNLNDDTCRGAAETGAQAYDASGSIKDLQSAVFTTVNRKGFGGFFISNPMLAELRCYVDSTNGVKRTMLLVKTAICVRVPAPFLIAFAQPAQDGRLVLNSKCIVELKPSSMSGSAL